MEFLIYLLTTIFVFLGAFIGILLSRNAFEEIKSLVDYLKILNILLISCLIFFVFYPFSWILGLIFSIVVSLLLFIFNNKYNSKTIYAALGGLFYASSLNQTSFLIAASLIFAYGISLSTIFSHFFYKNNKINDANHEKKLKDKKLTRKLFLDFFKDYFYFIIISLLFYSVFNFIFHI